jgi:hypothetical protein
MRKQRHSRERHTDQFEIVSGGLGSIPKCRLEIRPLTVFIGPQGVGKSLVAQVLYAFEELPFLMYVGSLQRGTKRLQSSQVFRWILDRLRSSERAFGTYASPNVHVRWTRGRPYEWPPNAPTSLDFRAFGATHQVTVPPETRKFLESVRAAVEGCGSHPDHAAAC